MAVLDSSRRFTTYVWIVLAATVAVVLSGDVVQATKSGAGCGESWPRCDGALIPTIGDAATAIEFTHRMLTTALGVAFAGMGLWAWRLYRHNRRHPAWKATLWAGAFFVVEVLIGALLVVFGWVEEDASIGRVVADGFHVVNTFLLIGALALVALYSAGARSLDIRSSRGWWLVGGAVLLIAIAITGAINSLADFLFESDEVSAAVRAELLESSGWLRQLRTIHPVLAVGGGIALTAIVSFVNATLPREADGARRVGYFVQGIVGLQVVVGLLNIALRTPLETQLVHLLLADALWIGFILYSVRVIARSDVGSRAAVPASST